MKHDHTKDGADALPGHVIRSTYVNGVILDPCGWAVKIPKAEWVNPKDEMNWWQQQVKNHKATIAVLQQTLDEAQARLDLFAAAAAGQEVAE